MPANQPSDRSTELSSERNVKYVVNERNECGKE